MSVWLGATGLALGAPGDLDPAFGTGGKALVSLGTKDSATSLALQPDGRLLVGGQTNGKAGTGDSGFLARVVSPQGTLDTSYAGGFGWSVFDFGGADSVTGVVQQSGGRIVVAGTSLLPNGHQLGFVSGVVNPGGTLDPAFATGGSTAPDLLLDENFTAVVRQSDDRLLVSGFGLAAGRADLTLARLTAAGALDKPFGEPPRGWSQVILPGVPGGGNVAQATAVALQPNGRIVMAGLSSKRHTDGLSDFLVARLTPEGLPDASFGPDANGIATLPMGTHGGALAVAAQPDGDIVLAGFGRVADRTNVAVARLLPGGTPDPGFSGDGKAFFNGGGNDSANAVALQPNGKIVLAGGTISGGVNDMLVVRLQPNGELDSTFGAGGRALVDFGGEDTATAVALQPDGDIVVAGTTLSPGAIKHIALARLQGDPPAGPGGAGGGAGGGGAGSSAAAPRCAGKVATIIGSAGPDKLKGTARADVIVGLGGSDRITGLRGNDIVCGGPGADRITGGPGADTLLGEAGPDLLSGGVGADVLKAGAGADRLLGGAGRDRLLGGLGADRLSGGVGKDLLTGGAGKDVQTQ